MNEQEKRPDTQQRDSYETGLTRPPKTHGGLVAILLVLVILLCGAISYLGVLNIRLHLKQSGNSDVPIQFYPAETAALDSGWTGDELLPGVEGRTVTAPEQAFYHWPAGVVVTKVEPHCPAARAGLSLGDILVQINDTPVTGVPDWQSVVAALKSGDKVIVGYCRDGESFYSFTCIWEREKED